MNAPTRPRHLVERAAALLREEARVGEEARLGDTHTAAFVQQQQRRPVASPPPPPPPPVSDYQAPPPPPNGPNERVDMAALERGDLQIGGPRRSRISEEYMVLSAQLMRSRQALTPTAAPANLLMVTSTQPGEGKSFSAINLAASLTQNRHTPTLLIDGDPKRDSLTEKMGLSDRAGLFDLVENPGLSAHSLVLSTAVEGLSLLPIGHIADHAGFARRAAAVLQVLARQMPDRLLILDAPPCRATSDPNLWSSEVGQIMMVVEAARTQRPDVERAVTLLQACPNIVLVLNKTGFDTSPGFGAYGYYGA